MRKSFFTGACTAMVTPFLNGQINYPMMEQLIRRQLDAGIRNLVVCGTTGEAPTLSDEEKLSLFRRCKDYVGGHAAIIAGTGSNSTDHAVFLSREAEKAGVDGLLVVSPYYNKATAAGLTAHYTQIAGAVSIPVILYNVPSRTGVDIPVSVYQALSEIPNIIGVKEASTSVSKLLSIRSCCGDDFQIWSGNDDMAAACLALGGCGVISVLSNVLPETVAAMVRAGLDGDFDTASALQVQLLPYCEALFCEVNPIPVKAAMKCIGYDCGSCRLPLTEPSGENALRIHKIFSRNS